MYQPSTNFWGKDPMNWWIGQVTDPEKGKWGDCLETTQADNGEDIYAFRCRVRIVGYHDCADDLPDEDLPLAHILLPPNTATTGGCGETVQYQGGEVVVGFFMDGEDAQQPVIFGTLFKQPFVADDLTTSQFNAKKQTCFVPYTPPKVVQTSGKQNQYQESPWPRAFTAGELAKSIAAKQKEASTNITIDNFSPCEDNEISKISNAIKNFTRKAEALQELNEASTYIDPIYGGIVDIQSEIQLATNQIHNSMTKLVRRGRSWLIQDTLDKLNLTLSDKVDKFNQVPTGQATKTLADVIFCNIEKIQDALKDYLSKSLENMIGQVLDVPICGIENFLSDMFGQINNIIDNNLGSMFSQLNNIQGGGIALPSKTFTKAIRFANIITNVLDCDAANCPEPTSYNAKNGVNKAIDDSFDNILAKSGLDRLKNIADMIDDLGDAIPAEPSRPDCSTNVLKCGPPRVDFLGSSGQGASGSAIVNALGNIIGVAINGPGFGFEEPPILSFFDSCDKGYGAGGYPVMGPVSKIADGTSVSVGGAGGVQLTSNGLPVNSGGQGGVNVTTPDGKLVTSGEDQIVAGGIGGTPVKAGSVGGEKLEVDGVPIVVNGQGGQNLIAGAFPVVIGSTNENVGGAGVGGAGGAGVGGAGVGGAGVGGAGLGLGVGAGADGVGAGLGVGADGVGAGLGVGAGGVGAGAGGVGAGGVGAGAGGFNGFNITVGGETDDNALYVPDPNGNELGVVGVVMTNPGQEYLPNSTETDLDGNVKEILPDPNATNYDGEQSYVTSLGDVVVQNAGFGYSDGDTATVSGGSIDSAGDTLLSDAAGLTDGAIGLTDGAISDTISDTVQKPGEAQVELDIQNGFIVGARVTNGGFGFSKLPNITINSDTGTGAKLSPVLNFTKVDDASKLADTNTPFNRNLPVITVISCIDK